MAVVTSNGTHTNEAARPVFEVKNPVTNDILGRVMLNTPDEIRDTVERARYAQPAWNALGIAGRAQLLRRWGDLVWEHQTDIIRMIRNETGKSDGMSFNEIFGVDMALNYYIHHAARILRSQQRIATLPLIHRAMMHYLPYGVVGIIAPWNFPYLLPFIDAVPALIAGNTLVFKPSEITPLTCELGVELMIKAGIPRDVVQIVHGDGRAGAALVDYVDYIGFTGSTAVGRKVAMRAAERLIPYSLELGGKDPMIVLADADVDMAATAMLRGAFENAGQACMSVERVYVEERIYEPLMERVRYWAKQYVVGLGDDARAHMGSLTNQRELDRTARHIADALAKGAQLIHGGQPRPDLGPLFFDPTILTDVNHTMDVMTEETFGPILPIMKVKNAEEAIELANDTEYGLAAAVYTRDLKRGEAVAKQIMSGDVSVNGVYFVIGTPTLPSGGMKNSGVGRRNGREGLLRYVKTQAIVINTEWVQKPALVLVDEQTKQMLLALRKIRRYVPFI